MRKRFFAALTGVLLAAGLAFSGGVPAHATITHNTAYWNHGVGREVNQNGFTQAQAYVALPIIDDRCSGHTVRSIWVAIGNSVTSNKFAQVGAIYDSSAGWSLFYQMPGNTNNGSVHGISVGSSGLHDADILFLNVHEDVNGNMWFSAVNTTTGYNPGWYEIANSAAYMDGAGAGMFEEYSPSLGGWVSNAESNGETYFTSEQVGGPSNLQSVANWGTQTSYDIRTSNNTVVQSANLGSSTQKSSWTGACPSGN